jgi:hypothetical protein
MLDSCTKKVTFPNEPDRIDNLRLHLGSTHPYIWRTGGKAAGAWSWLLIFYPLSRLRLPRAVAEFLSMSSRLNTSLSTGNKIAFTCSSQLEIIFVSAASHGGRYVTLLTSVHVESYWTVNVFSPVVFFAYGLFLSFTVWSNAFRMVTHLRYSSYGDVMEKSFWLFGSASRWPPVSYSSRSWSSSFLQLAVCLKGGPWSSVLQHSFCCCADDESHVFLENCIETRGPWGCVARDSLTRHEVDELTVILTIVTVGKVRGELSV